MLVLLVFDHMCDDSLTKRGKMNIIYRNIHHPFPSTKVYHATFIKLPTSQPLLITYILLHVFTTNYTCHLFFSRAKAIDNLALICSILNLTGGFILQHVSLKKLDLLSTKPRATLTILLCSTNFPMNAWLT